MTRILNNTLRTGKSPKVAILIKSFMRENSLINLLSSIYEHEQDVDIKVYVADSGPLSGKKKKVYEELRRDGHCVVQFAEGKSVTACRNEMISRIDEAYVLRLDDDYQFCAETNLGRMMCILDRKDEIGCVASIERQSGIGKGVFDGQISPYQGFFSFEGSTLTKHVKKPASFSYDSICGVRYATCDFTRNFLLCRMEVFDTVRWDERISFAGEHLDFMLQIYDSPWKIAFTPDVIHIHNESVENPRYDRYVQKKWETERGHSEVQTKEKVLRMKWGVENIEVSYEVTTFINMIAARGLNYLGTLVGS